MEARARHGLSSRCSPNMELQSLRNPPYLLKRILLVPTHPQLGEVEVQ